MSKKQKSDKAVELIDTTEAGTAENVAAAKPEPKRKKVKGVDSKKLHIEIARGNWKRMDAYISTYNSDPARITPKIGVAHVVNQALAGMLGATKGGK